MARIHNQELFTTLSIRDLLWGYQDPLLNQLQALVGEAMISSDEFGLLLGVSSSFLCLLSFVLFFILIFTYVPVETRNFIEKHAHHCDVCDIDKGNVNIDQTSSAT